MTLGGGVVGSVIGMFGIYMFIVGKAELVSRGGAQQFLDGVWALAVWVSDGFWKFCEAGGALAV